MIKTRSSKSSTSKTLTSKPFAFMNPLERMRTLRPKDVTPEDAEVKDIDFKDLITSDYWELSDQLDAGTNKVHNWLKGGRGSLKSSFVSLAIVRGMQRDPEAHAVVFRKVADTMRGSVFEQYKWAIEMLGTSDLWTERTAPLSLIYNNPETGRKQFILFKGGDKPKKIKSAKFAQGYVKYEHFEEAEEFEKAEDFETINLTMLRGDNGGTPAVFYSYNPPKHRGHWLNKHILEVELRPDSYILHTDFRTCANEHPDWLGKTFLMSAAITRKLNRRHYEHVYLGLDVNTGLEVFVNVERRKITAEERESFEHAREAGMDFGFGKDPLVYLDTYFDSKKDTVYIWGEVWGIGMRNKVAVENVKKRNPHAYAKGSRGRVIHADSAEPRTIAEFNGLGLNLWGARKEAGSVDHGVKWLSDRTKIIIDEDSPNAFREFTAYAVVEDAHGNVKAGYPDKDNHSIDTVRYAQEDNIRALKWDY